MARKTKKKKMTLGFFKILKIGIICVFIAFISVVSVRKIISVIKHADYFKIEKIVNDPSLAFIKSGSLKNLVGRSLFVVDVQKVQKRLQRQYPQVTDLKLVKRFPDEIWLIAKKRDPLARIQFREEMIFFSDDGYVLPAPDKKKRDLPLIEGIATKKLKPRLGLPLEDQRLQTALTILKDFKGSKGLKSYDVSEINVSNLSRIYFSLNDFQVIMDWDNIFRKIKNLEVVLTEGKVDLKTVKYIDLRFKEPVVGKKK